MLSPALLIYGLISCTIGGTVSMLRMWCILGRGRLRKVLFPRLVTAPAVAVLLCGIGTGFALVMFVASVEAFALGGYVCNTEGTLRHVGLARLGLTHMMGRAVVTDCPTAVPTEESVLNTTGRPTAVDAEHCDVSAFQWALPLLVSFRNDPSTAA
jgi:hypothetical protein